MTKEEKIQELREKIDELEEKCLSAVMYVGLANYQEREDEALKEVEDAFAQLWSLIKEFCYFKADMEMEVE